MRPRGIRLKSIEMRGVEVAPSHATGKEVEQIRPSELRLIRTTARMPRIKTNDTQRPISTGCPQVLNTAESVRAYGRYGGGARCRIPAIFSGRTQQRIRKYARVVVLRNSRTRHKIVLIL